MDLLQFLFCEFGGEFFVVLVLDRWWWAVAVVFWRIFVEVGVWFEEIRAFACILFWCSLKLRGLDKVSRRDIETALPGLRSIRFPGVLDLENPAPAATPAGEAEEKVMVGIKSVLLRWAEAPDPEFEFEWWNELSPSATAKKNQKSFFVFPQFLSVHSRSQWPQCFEKTGAKIYFGADRPRVFKNVTKYLNKG